MRFDISVDVSGLEVIAKNIEKANDMGIFAMSEQALKDSNYYCKMDQGTLINSSLINTNISLAECGVTAAPAISEKGEAILAAASGSDLKAGELVWSTPYSNRQYFLASAYTDKNHNAQMMWFHKAKDVCLEDKWLPAYKQGYNRGMNGNG